MAWCADLYIVYYTENIYYQSKYTDSIDPSMTVIHPPSVFDYE